MPSAKRTPESKRANPPRDVNKAQKFLKDWESLTHSGKHDMNVLKEAMMLLIANDAPLPPEWKDHTLKGKFAGTRECHVKGDLLLIYRISKEEDKDLITFLRAGTHSELFGE